jgi:plastocyanin
VSVWAGRVLRAAVAILAAATVVHAPAAAAEIEISAAALRPQTAVAAVGERVTFVDRSGRRAHLEFHELPRGHRAFQVPGEIWAVFHVPGRHGYTVHLSGPTMELHGVVDVREATGPAREPRECRGVSVQGECLDR